VVLGGSGGARSLNEQVPRALYKLRQLLGGWTIVHQTGAREASATAALYRKFDLDAMVTPFVRDMPGLFQGSDLAICRAGGTTLAELAAAEIPTLLVPYPAASNQHQLANAQLFVDHGAAVMVNELTVESRLDNALRDALQPLLISDQVRQAMGRQMASLARPDAAWRVATLIGELLTKRQQPTAA
jgi:UDP-N-acetylglucosamine--N-acetylmuramyl-(pentapeptide) pyrophosphoryl-undecaprenol N-acetylglucosamine transferase